MPDGQLGAQAVLLPVLWGQDDARLDGVSRAFNGHFPTVQDDLTAVLGVHPEDGTGGLGAPSAHQPGKAHDLPLIQGKVDVPHHAPGVEALHLKDLSPLIAAHPGELLLDFPAHHVGDNLVQGNALEVHAGDVLAVPHDGHPVHNVLQLLQAVGNVYNAAALGLQLPDDAE